MARRKDRRVWEPPIQTRVSDCEIETVGVTSLDVIPQTTGHGHGGGPSKRSISDCVNQHRYLEAFCARSRGSNEVSNG